MARRTILRSLLHRLSEEQRHRCAYCCIPFHYLSRSDATPTLDHVHPKSKGGKAVYNNLVAACVHCNRKKGNSPALEFARSKSVLKRRRKFEKPNWKF